MLLRGMSKVSTEPRRKRIFKSSTVEHQGKTKLKLGAEAAAKVVIKIEV